jgi:hypothetical protein
VANIDIKNIIETIPEILQYFVSGYIFMTLFTFLASKVVDQSVKLICSCVVSFIWVSLIRSLNSVFIQSHILNSIWVISCLSCILSIICAIVFSKLYTNKNFKRFMVNTFTKTPHETVWRNVVDLETGTNLKVYLKGKDYYILGHLYSYEEKGNESWFCLHCPVFYTIKDNISIYTQENNNNAFLAFNLQDVDMIEIFV